MSQRLLRSSGSESDLSEMTGGKNKVGQLTQTAFDKIKAEKEAMLKEIESLKAEHQEKIKAFEESILDLDKKVDEVERRYETAQIDWKKDVNEAKQELEAKKEDKEKSDSKVGKYKQKYYNAKNDSSEMKETISDLEGKYGKAMRKQTNLKDEIATLNEKVNSLLLQRKFSDDKKKSLIRQIQKLKDSFIASNLVKDGIDVPFNYEPNSERDERKERARNYNHEYKTNKAYPPSKQYCSQPYPRRSWNSS